MSQEEIPKEMIDAASLLNYYFSEQGFKKWAALNASDWPMIKEKLEQTDAQIVQAIVTLEKSVEKLAQLEAREGLVSSVLQEEYDSHMKNYWAGCRGCINSANAVAMVARRLGVEIRR